MVRGLVSGLGLECWGQGEGQSLKLRSQCQWSWRPGLALSVCRVLG